MFDIELPNSRSNQDLENIALSLGLPKRYVKTLSVVSIRREIVPETIMNIYMMGDSYQNVIYLHEKLNEDPYQFYQNNKKITSVDKKLITFGSLSLSYSFASLHRLLRNIIHISEELKGYVGFMKETSDESYSLENIVKEPFMFNEMYLDSRVKEKYLAFKQDLRGNKIPANIIESLTKKLKFDKRSLRRDEWGLSGITQESLIDSMYLFFGSEKGTEFIHQWRNKQNKNELLDEFEFLVYNNPYINPLLIDHSMQTYMTDEFIKSAEIYLERNKNKGNRINNSEIDFGLDENINE